MPGMAAVLGQAQMLAMAATVQGQTLAVAAMAAVLMQAQTLVMAPAVAAGMDLAETEAITDDKADEI